MKNKKSKSVLLTALKNVDLLNPVLPQWLCVSLCKVLVSFILKHWCAEEVYFVTLDLDIYREKQRGEPCLNEPFLLMLHPGRL